MSFFNFFSIFLGCMTLNIACLYMTMALKVHWSQYYANLPLKNDDLFVAVDMITVYIYHVIYPNNLPRYKTHQVYTVQLLLAAQRSRHPASVSTPSTVSNTLPSSWAGVHAPTCVKLHISFDINQQQQRWHEEQVCLTLGWSSVVFALCLLTHSYPKVT